MNSKSLLRYILFIETNSGNSATHGPHQVAHTLIRRSLSEPFLTRSLIPSALMLSRLTGSFAHCSFALLIQPLFSAHLMEQPNTLVVVTGTSLLFSKASMALRASRLCGVLPGFSTSSMRPL